MVTLLSTWSIPVFLLFLLKTSNQSLLITLYSISFKVSKELYNPVNVEDVYAFVPYESEAKK